MATVAYLMSRFPHLPETFILREMDALEQHGWQVALYPLLRQQQTVVHAEAQPWLARAHHVPFLSRQVAQANVAALRQQPKTYAGIWRRTLWDNRGSANFLGRALLLLPKAVRMAALMQREGVDHIHAHYATHPALVAWIIQRLTGLSYSITVHAHDIFVRQAMLATKLREASFIAAISAYNRQFLIDTVGAWVAPKIHVVHCGIIPQHYTPRPRQAANQRFELISIGSLQPYKGQRYLLEACAHLRQRGIPLRCRIIGGGELRAELRQQIDDLQLQGIVELTGPLPQDQVAQTLPEADCYVQPSIITPSGKMEGIPVALMEALAAQLPVVASAISGVPELVRDGITGWLVPPADAAALADALAAVYANPAERQHRAVAGRAFVEREFHLHTNVARLIDLFSAAIHGKAASVPTRGGL